MSIFNDSDMFPHTLTVHPVSYSQDSAGGSVRTDGSGSSIPCNAQPVDSDTATMAAVESGQVIGSVVYRISTATEPAVAPEQRVTVVIAGATIELVAASQAKLVARGEMWRFNASQRV